MKRLVWMGIFLLSASWLFLLSLFQKPQWITGIVILVFGILCTIVAFKENTVSPPKKTYLFFTLPLLIASIVIPFPFSIGAILLFLGLLISILSQKWLRTRKLIHVWPGLFFSGILLLLQASIYPLFVKVAARFHGTELFPPVLSIIGKAMGLQTTSSGDSLFLGSISSNPAVTVSWESLGVFVLLYLFIGMVLFFFLTGKKHIGRYALGFFLIGIIYIIIRYVVLLAIAVETVESIQWVYPFVLEPFFDPFMILISFLPLVLLFTGFLHLGDVNGDLFSFPSFKIRKRQILASLLIFFFVFLMVGSYGFHDPGLMKNGRVLIDEYHSTWEPSERPVDKEWYGSISTYNYYAWAEFLKHYYTVTQNNNSLLTADILSDYDILILKCPTSLYSDAEVAAIVEFVENGGGLYLIGDHTNVFGMNSYLNKVSRRFGIEFNTDATHEPYAIGDFSVYSPPALLAHPIVQSTPSFQFLTSCTLDAPLTAEEVMIGDKMITFPGTYATAGFFTEDKKFEQTRGVFLQSVALKYGKGRIVAYSDSTTFSTYCFYLSGYRSFNLGVLDYLNRENSLDFFNSFFFVLSLICLIGAVVLLRHENKFVAVFLIVSLCTFSFSLAAPTFTSLNTAMYPLPEPTTPFEKRISFDGEHTTAIIEAAPLYRETSPDVERQLYDTFFVWTQRVGCIPTVEKTLESALLGGDLVVILNPTISFTFEELTALSDYVQAGGKVLVLDTIYNSGSTANEVLMQFNMEATMFDRQQQANVGETDQQSTLFLFQNLSVGLATEPYLSLQGGQAILKGEYGQPIFSVQHWGNGLLAAFVDSSVFSNWKMGGVFTIPNVERRGFYNLEYYLFESLLYDEDDVDPVTMTGSLYVDINENKRYDSSVDQPISNATLSAWKLDNLETGVAVLKKYSTSATTSTNETGHYHLSQMMPGYYLISATTQEGVLIHQSKVVLSSGSTVIYNISRTQSSSLQGVIYFDENNNAVYNASEEMSNVAVELLIQNNTGTYLPISSQITGMNGTYTFSSLTPGQYILNATKTDENSGNAAYSTFVSIYVFEDTVHEVNLSLDLTPVSIHGQVHYENETKSDILVSIYANRSVLHNTATPFIIARSNTTGNFSLTLLPGFYNISINQTVLENGQNTTYYYRGSLIINIGEGRKIFDIPLSIKD